MKEYEEWENVWKDFDNIKIGESFRLKDTKNVGVIVKISEYETLNLNTVTVPRLYIVDKRYGVGNWFYDIDNGMVLLKTKLGRRILENIIRKEEGHENFKIMY